MPSIRKRIGYLPTPIVQELITQISKNEKLSQSKVVGLLVEEALLARGLFSPSASNLQKKKIIDKHRNTGKSFYHYDELYELISDKGITYNKNEYEIQPNSSKEKLSEYAEKYNVELFEQFKQFLLYQKMIGKK
tara:strand:- start:84 stop:485 length:402 start_codon:yes stop_codon:yes gene_type:complete